MGMNNYVATITDAGEPKKEQRNNAAIDAKRASSIVIPWVKASLSAQAQRERKIDR